MNFRQVDIEINTVSFLHKEMYKLFGEINKILKNRTGIVDFFENEDDYIQLKQTLNINPSIVAENRAEYGDYYPPNSVRVTDFS
jgi:hypothetical protein